MQCCAGSAMHRLVVFRAQGHRLSMSIRQGWGSQNARLRLRRPKLAYPSQVWRAMGLANNANYSEYLWMRY